MLLLTASVFAHGPGKIDKNASGPINEPELRAQMSNIVEQMSASVLMSVGAPEFNEWPDQSKVRMLEWAYRLTPYIRSLPYEENQKIAVMDLVLMMARMNAYMKSERAANYYGEAIELIQPRVLESYEASLALMASYLEPDAYYEFFKRMSRWVDAHPMTAFIGRESAIILASHREMATDLKKAAPSFFLGDLGSTVEDATVQMHRLNLQMAAMEDRIEWLPVYIYWLTYMFALEPFRGGSIADSIGGLSKVDIMLAPLQELGGDLSRLSNSVERLGELQTSMQILSRNVNVLTHEARPSLAALVAMEQQIEQAANNLEILNSQVVEMRTTFNRDLDSAAESLGVMASFVQDPESFIWTLLKAGIVLLIVFYVLLFLYKIFIRMLATHYGEK